MALKKYFLSLATLVFIVLAIFTGCSSQNQAIREATKDAKDPETVKAFEKWFNDTIDDVKSKPDYKRIPLDTEEEQKWFLTQLFLAWDKKITKDEFVKTGLTKYPDYKESLEYLASKLP